MAHAFQIRMLRKAAGITGGPERLCEILCAPRGAFCRWLEGDEPMPERFQRMVLDFLSDMESTSTLPRLLIYPSVRGKGEQRIQRNAALADKP
jgi:hypothetical protein